MHAPGLQGDQPPSHPVDSNTHGMNQQAATEHSYPTSTLAQEKPPNLQEQSIASQYPSSPPPGEHPAIYAPFADDINPLEKQRPEVQVPQYSYGAPPNSPGPLPVKLNPETLDEAQKGYPIEVAPDENPLHTQLPQSPPPVATIATQPTVSDNVMVFSPPTQISHPNKGIDPGTWAHGLCDCTGIGTCCLGLFCPCILYGKTQYRISMKSRKEDPTNLLGYEACNGSCMAMAMLCGCQCELVPSLKLYSKLLIFYVLGLLATVQHTRTRKSYGIRGDICSDCVRATCCTCCTLIQDEKEIQKREGEHLKAARASSAAFSAPYMTPGPMSYPPPPTREVGR